MSAFNAPGHTSLPLERPFDSARPTAYARAALALIWAVALFLAAGGHAPSTGAELSTGVAVVLATYPLIDVAASIATTRHDDAPRALMFVNALISAAAAAAVAVTGFGSDAGATVASFGVWASVSGLIQLGVAIRRRRAVGGQLPMIISGGLSAIAGVTFIASSGAAHAQVTDLAGYMALGAVLYLLWAFREQSRPPRAR